MGDPNAGKEHSNHPSPLRRFLCDVNGFTRILFRQRLGPLHTRRPQLFRAHEPVRPNGDRHRNCCWCSPRSCHGLVMTRTQWARSHYDLSITLRDMTIVTIVMVGLGLTIGHVTEDGLELGYYLGC